MDPIHPSIELYEHKFWFKNIFADVSKTVEFYDVEVDIILGKTDCPWSSIPLSPAHHINIDPSVFIERHSNVPRLLPTYLH